MLNKIGVKISVIIPVYNIEKYVEKSIRSVLGQDYKNIEIIIINDGSTDSSGQICTQLANEDSRIILINQENRGLSAARNIGLEYATGEYIGFVDGDDWIDKDMYSTLIRQAIDNNADIVSCNFQMVDENHYVVKEIDNLITDSQRLYTNSINALDYIIESDNIAIWNKLYKRYLFDTIRFPVGVTFEDAYIMHLLVEKAKRVIILKAVKYKYLQREGSITYQMFEGNHINRLIAYMKRYSYLVARYPELERGCRKYVFIVLLYVMEKAAQEDIYKHREELLPYINEVMKMDFETCELNEDIKVICRLIVEDPTLRLYEMAQKIRRRNIYEI